MQRFTPGWLATQMRVSPYDILGMLHYVYEDEKKRFTTESELLTGEALLACCQLLLRRICPERSPQDMALMWACQKLRPFCLNAGERFERHLALFDSGGKNAQEPAGMVVVADFRHVTFEGSGVYFTMDEYAERPKLDQTPFCVCQFSPEVFMLYLLVKYRETLLEGKPNAGQPSSRRRQATGGS